MIDADRALELLEQVVKGKEDFVYQKHPATYGGQQVMRCLYVWKGECDCLVGAALHLGGVPLTVLMRYEGEGVVSIQRKEPGILSHEAAEVLNSAQGVQDNGNSWGGALKAARNIHRALKEG